MSALSRPTFLGRVVAGCALVLAVSLAAPTSAPGVTVGSDGKELGSLYFSEEILDTSSAGGYVAVLTANGMDLFDKSMERTASLDTTQGATAVLPIRVAPAPMPASTRSSSASA